MELLAREAAYAVPVSGASGEIESDTRLRRSLVVGTGADYDIIVGADTMLGQYLPKDNPKTPRSFAVLGPKMRDELFGNENPLGKTVRVNSQRFRIVGVLPPKGDFLGFFEVQLMGNLGFIKVFLVLAAMASDNLAFIKVS